MKRKRVEVITVARRATSVQCVPVEQCEAIAMHCLIVGFISGLAVMFTLPTLAALVLL